MPPRASSSDLCQPLPGLLSQDLSPPNSSIFSGAQALGGLESLKPQFSTQKSRWHLHQTHLESDHFSRLLLTSGKRPLAPLTLTGLSVLPGSCSSTPGPRPFSARPRSQVPWSGAESCPCPGMSWPTPSPPCQTWLRCLCFFVVLGIKSRALPTPGSNVSF